MGPILDQCGVEQGGLNSSDLYKLYNNIQLELAYKEGSYRQLKLAENKINNIFSSDYIIENNKQNIYIIIVVLSKGVCRIILLFLYY